jgi:hypothetical protein
VAAIVKSKLFDRVGYVRHEAQQACHDATERFRIAAWGRRGGKSRVGGMELMPAAYLAHARRQYLEETGERHEYWIVGPEYSDSEKEFRVIYNALKGRGMPFDKPGTYNNPLGGDMHVSLWDGRFQVHAKSAKYPDTLVGEGLRGLVLSEAAKLKRIVWEKHLRPTLADYKGWLYGGSTPEGKNWFYELYMKGQNPNEPEYWSLRAPAWVNPFVYPMGGSMEGINNLRELRRLGCPITQEAIELLGLDPELASLEGGMSDELFNQEIAAMFTEFVGRVFKDFEEEEHVRPLLIDPDLPLFAAVDWGFTNPTVWLLIQVSRLGQVRVLDEYYEPGKTPEEVAAEIRARGLCPSNVRAFYPDPASPGDSATLSQKLRVPSMPGTGGELKDRLELIRKYLKVPEDKQHLSFDHPERQPNLIIDPRCKGLIHDMLEYRYPREKKEETNNREEPLKKDDHGPEALGRFFKGYFGATTGRTNARVRKADVRG